MPGSSLRTRSRPPAFSHAPLRWRAAVWVMLSDFEARWFSRIVRRLKHLKATDLLAEVIDRWHRWW